MSKELSDELQLREDEGNLLGDDDETFEKYHFVWQNILFVCNIYNFITVTYFIGIPGFPYSIWTYLEFITEILMITEFVFNIIMNQLVTKHLKHLNFFRESNRETWKARILSLVSAVPYSIIMYASLPYSRHLELWVALVRGLKLLRLHQLNHYFDVKDIRSKNN